MVLRLIISFDMAAFVERKRMIRLRCATSPASIWELGRSDFGNARVSELLEWLRTERTAHVAMESTDVH